MKEEFYRISEKQIEEALDRNKVLIIYGPRQVGKTTIVRRLTSKYNVGYFLCEEPDVAYALTHKTSSEMKSFLGNYDIIILDEAQKITDIGTTLKLLHDTYPALKIIATGSSSFDLANKVNEPLTGRNLEFHVYPLSIPELSAHYGVLETERTLPERLIYGNYPEIIALPNNRSENLKKITNDYLYKDLLSYEGIRKSSVLADLLKLLALQTGSQISYAELASSLSVGRETVRSYIDILEKAFIVFRLYPLFTQKRYEVKKMPKIYFWDNGVRNTILQNYNNIDIRDDVGRLFENFFISEKMKEHEYKKSFSRLYYWRTQDGQEIDLVEEFRSGEEYKIYECKFGSLEKRVPAKWLKDYKNYTHHPIFKGNIVKELTK